MVVFGIAALLILASVWLTPALIRRRRIASALRPGWWERFERDFRAYASAPSVRARDAERHA